MLVNNPSSTLFHMHNKHTAGLIVNHHAAVVSGLSNAAKTFCSLFGRLGLWGFFGNVAFFIWCGRLGVHFATYVHGKDSHC